MKYVICYSREAVGNSMLFVNTWFVSFLYISFIIIDIPTVESFYSDAVVVNYGQAVYDRMTATSSMAIVAISVDDDGKEKIIGCTSAIRCWKTFFAAQRCLSRNIRSCSHVPRPRSRIRATQHIASRHEDIFQYRVRHGRCTEVLRIRIPVFQETRLPWTEDLQ